MVAVSPTRLVSRAMPSASVLPVRSAVVIEKPSSESIEISRRMVRCPSCVSCFVSETRAPATGSPVSASTAVTTTSGTGWRRSAPSASSWPLAMAMSFRSKLS